MNSKFRIFATCLLVLAAAAGRVFAGEMRDPMRPAGTPASAAATAARPATAQSLKLEGVIAGAQRVAIVNGRLVRVGDTVAGARIVEVSSQGVRYERAGKLFTLTLAAAPANTNVRVARSDKKP